MARGKNGIPHSYMSSEITIALCQLDGAADCSDRRGDDEEEVSSAWRVVFFHAHNFAFTLILRQRNGDQRTQFRARGYVTVALTRSKHFFACTFASSLLGLLPAASRTMTFSEVRMVRVNKWRQFFKNEDGAALAEYGILVAFIAIVAITAVTFFGSKVSAKFSQYANQLS